MIRSISRTLVAATLLFVPALALAGGPPFLCLPVDGVNAKNAAECSKLLGAKLENKLWPHAGRIQGFKLIPQGDQWYLAFHMNDDVRLSELNKAFEGSAFSIPKDKLQLFGHVILEIEARPDARESLVSRLKTLPSVAVEDSKSQNSVLQVTIDMPYPTDVRRDDVDSIGSWDTFQRNDLNSDADRTLVNKNQLSGYEAIRAEISKHEASLKDVHWDAGRACRVLGGVAKPRTTATKS